DLGFNRSSVLADLVNRDRRAILAGRVTVPLRFESAPFRGGSALNLGEPWTSVGVDSPAARRLFSPATCNGCHPTPPTGTAFVPPRPREPGAESGLSAFLLGAAVPDPVDGELQILNDLLRRKTDLERLVCGCTDERCDAASEDLHRYH